MDLGTLIIIIGIDIMIGIGYGFYFTTYFEKNNLKRKHIILGCLFPTSIMLFLFSKLFDKLECLFKKVGIGNKLNNKLEKIDVWLNEDIQFKKK